MSENIVTCAIRSAVTPVTKTHLKRSRLARNQTDILKFKLGQAVLTFSNYIYLRVLSVSFCQGIVSFTNGPFTMFTMRRGSNCHKEIFLLSNIMQVAKIMILFTLDHS